MPCPKMLRVKELGNIILFHVHIDWKEPKKLVVSMFFVHLQQWEDGKEITSLHTPKAQNIAIKV
jgi:trehalose-6-phosphate synthase